MQSLKHSVRLWLERQAHSLKGLTFSAVIKQASTPADELLVKWPEQHPLPDGLPAVARQSLRKQALQMAPSNDSLLLAHPIMVGKQCWGVLVLQLPKRSRHQLQHLLKLIRWHLEWLEVLLAQPVQASPEADVLHLLGQVLNCPHSEQSGLQIVNALAAKLACQRVSIGWTKQNKVHLQAVSNSAMADVKTPHAQSLSEAMLEALEQSSNLHYPAADNAAPHILQHHKQLQTVTGSHSVHTYLLKGEHDTVAVLTLETSAQRPFSKAGAQLLQQCAPLLGRLLEWQLRAEAGLWQRFKQRWQQSRRQSTGIMSGRRLVVLATLMALLILCLPGTHWVYGKATLASEDKRTLVAPQDGFLASINASAGEQVESGQLLAQLDDSDLRLEQRQLQGQLQQQRQEYDEALANYQRAQASIIDSQIEQTQAQLALIQQQLQRTQLLAPVTGLVVSADINDSLGAPVSKGDILFEVAGSTSYRVEAYVNERDIRHLHTGQQGRLSLGSLPGVSFAVQVERITPVSMSHDGQNTFLVKAALLDQQQLGLLRPGMTGNAKIDTGNAPLGWVWFHALFDRLRLALWW